jgi:predicted kinase
MIHLVCGSTGAGKTTYAQQLADEVGGMVFSIDAWMITLFGEDTPEQLTPSWFMPRVDRCEAQMKPLVLRLAALGIPCVLDLGFQRKEHRDGYRSFGAEHGLELRMHVLDVPSDVRWARVSRRNVHADRPGVMNVSRPMFDYIETIWEPPTADEVDDTPA